MNPVIFSLWFRGLDSGDVNVGGLWMRVVMEIWGISRVENIELEKFQRFFEDFQAFYSF